MRRKNLVLWIKRDGFLKNERLESTKASSPLRSAGAIQIRLAKRSAIGKHQTKRSKEQAFDEKTPPNGAALT